MTFDLTLYNEVSVDWKSLETFPRKKRRVLKLLVIFLLHHHPIHSMRRRLKTGVEAERGGAHSGHSLNSRGETENYQGQDRSTMSEQNGNGPIIPEVEKIPTLGMTVQHYDLNIIPNWINASMALQDFKATVAIHFEMSQPGNIIYLHSDGLNISSAVLESEVTQEKIHSDPVDGISYEPELERVKIKLLNQFQPGKNKLTMNYVGPVNKKLKGLFKSKVTGTPSEKLHQRYNYLTHFAPTYARGCFPCWDEPGHKATFDITLVAPDDVVTLSNMAVIEETEFPGDGKHVHDLHLRKLKFDRSPRMSTYLLAFAMGQFDYTEAKTDSGITCRVYTPKGKTDQGSFALNVATKSLEFYSKYFEIPYPLPKLDLVPVADFPCGAMENWGLITFRETTLLVDQNHSSSLTKQKVALTVAHEIAHQWFGNLVTMDWWEGLWLNEGFASFIEFLCVDSFFPEYDVWSYFAAETYAPALRLDSLASSHPIEVVSPIDLISYNKGASIIRMLYQFLGDAAFRKGMSAYLSEHAYKNTKTSDLWEAFDQIPGGGQSIREMMTTWTKQMGFPLVTVNEEVWGPNKELILSLSQTKFIADPNAKDDTSSYKWMIPLTFVKGCDPSAIMHKELMKTDSNTRVVLNNVEENEWVKLNAGIAGFYRVAYQPSMLSKFILAIKNKSMSPMDRLSIVDDLFAVVSMGKLPTSQLLDLLVAYKDEDDTTVWETLVHVVDTLDLLLAQSKSNELFNKFAQSLFVNILTKIGWDARANESHPQKILRSIIIGKMVSLGHPPTVQEAARRFKLVQEQGFEGIDADLRKSIYRAAVMTADSIDTFHVFIDMYKKTEMLEERLRILLALPFLPKKEWRAEMLSFVMYDPSVKPQDSVRVLIALATTKHGQYEAWSFFKQLWKTFQDRFPNGFFILNYLMENLLENFRTEDEAKDVENFFKEHPFVGTESSIQRALENIRINHAWLQRDDDAIYDSLSKLIVDN